MTHTTTAIEKAIEGGYKQPIAFMVGGKNYIENNEAFLSPLFWQALGKSLEWKNPRQCGCCYKEPKFCRCSEFEMYEAWQINWHRFIDALAEGKTAEDFFGELLANEK